MCGSSYEFCSGTNWPLTHDSADHECLIRTPLKKLLPRLDHEQFWHIHWGTVVLVNQIARVLRDPHVPKYRMPGHRRNPNSRYCYFRLGNMPQTRTALA